VRVSIIMSTLPSSQRLRALVVGGTSGIGEGIALALAKRDCDVTVAGRSQQRGAAVVEKLQDISPSKMHKFIPVDGFDLKSLHVLKDEPAPDVVVLTQGMATIQGYTPTKDGLDQKLQLHYFSRIYLARLLAPGMAKQQSESTSGNTPPRILSVLSAGVHGKYKHFEDDFQVRNHYSIKNAADAAGFYTDAGFEAFSRENPSFIVAHAAPGFVSTRWGTEMPFLLRALIRPMQQAFGKSPEECGNTLTNSIFEITEPGYFLIDEKGQQITKNGMKHTKDERDVIWEKTLELLPEI
jgi:NAD(P)-dependent dehydrogenase (short-subunit alcohol dehydrogenase family)